MLLRRKKMKLLINIRKALTAAGGFAQAMERQDLEGKTTNATGKDAKRINKEKEKQNDEDSDD